MSRYNGLIKKEDNIKINYLLENMDTKENFLKENIIVKVSDLDSNLQKQIVNSLVGSWFCIDYPKIEEERHLKIHTSKFKNTDVGEFIILEVENEHNHKLIGKVIKKTTKYTLFDLKTPFEEFNWKVSVEVLDVILEDS